MRGTSPGHSAQLEQIRQVVASSLFVEAGVYRPRPDGSLQFDGSRPGPDWHAHGYFWRLQWMLRRARVVRRRVFKRRWLLVGTTTTCHSRPPEEHPRLAFCTLIIVVRLWAWLDGGRGLQHCLPVLADMDQAGSTRSAQRWLCRALPCADMFAQAARRAVIERSEPRPVEHLFPAGLSPPDGLARRRWRAPLAVGQLWTGLATIVQGAVALPLPATLLLAEARGRWTDQDSFPA